MKNLTLIVFFLVNTYVFAQEKISVQQKEWAIDNAMQPAFVVEIPQTTGKKAINLWEKTLVPKNIFDTFKKLPKMEKEEKNQWVIKRVFISEICPDTVDVYTRINETKDRITFVTLFNNNGNFIGNNSNQAGNASEYVRKYALELYRQGVNTELDDLKKELKKMESDYTGYNKDNRKLNRKSNDSQSSLNIMKTPSEASAPILSEEQMADKQKEIKKEEKALKKYSKKMDKNTDKQKKLTKEIKKKEDEIKAVEEKLRNIK